MHTSRSRRRLSALFWDEVHGTAPFLSQSVVHFHEAAHWPELLLFIVGEGEPREFNRPEASAEPSLCFPALRARREHY